MTYHATDDFAAYHKPRKFIRPHTFSTEDYICGSLAAEIIRDRNWPDDAKGFHDALMIALQSAGMSARREVAVTGVSKDRNGRMDIVAEYEGGRVGIELDRHLPREKSVLKLKKFAGFRIIALRGFVGDKALREAWPNLDLLIDDIIVARVSA